MCTVRCFAFGVKSLRSGFSYSLSTRPQISTYVTPAFSSHTSINYRNCRRDFSLGPLAASTCNKGHGRWQPQLLRCTYLGTQAGTPPSSEDGEPAKLSLFQRYKKMLKEYWYVLIPVHCATSAVWFGSFYYAATCGVDVVPLLEYLGVSEEWIRPLRSSSLGHLAVASAFYKLATPARYAVTVGGTTLAIRVLTARGLIKPMPSKAKMKEMVKQKRDDFISRKTSQH